MASDPRVYGGRSESGEQAEVPRTAEAKPETCKSQSKQQYPRVTDGGDADQCTSSEWQKFVCTVLIQVQGGRWGLGLLMQTRTNLLLCRGSLQPAPPNDLLNGAFGHPPI